MKTALAAIATAASMFAAPMAHAAVITSTYTPTGGNSWLADFTVVNDGTPATFAGFTIDFLNATDLALVGSPATWDSLVFQPDPSIPDAGFLDAFALSPANYLSTGQSQGGFKVSFIHLAGGTPGALPFVINSAAFAPLFAGNTTVSAVPEPSTVLLMALGLAAVGRVARNGAKTRASHKEVTA